MSETIFKHLENLSQSVSLHKGGQKVIFNHGIIKEEKILPFISLRYTEVVGTEKVTECTCAPSEFFECKYCDGTNGFFTSIKRFHLYYPTAEESEKAFAGNSTKEEFLKSTKYIKAS